MRLVDDATPLIVETTRDELRLIASAIGEALEALDDWEVPIRMGFEVSEVRGLLREVKDLYRALPPDGGS
jgi:hypothetical protein